jgi:hypothetical protein
MRLQEVAKFFLAQNMQRKWDESLLEAVRNGDVSIAANLIQTGADINTRDARFDFRTPLIWAAHNGDKAMVTFLLEQGADMNGIDCKGKSAYAFAIEKGHIKLLHMLHQPAPIREMRRPSPLPELKNITPPTTSTTKIRLERRIGFGQYEKHEQKYAQQKLNQRAQRNSLNIERCCSPAVSPWDSGDF